MGLAPRAAAAVTTAAAALQWQEAELTFTATRDAANPYTDTEAWADFTHEDGTTIRRPMFWDGGRTFRVRFASTKASGTWRWTSSDRQGDPGLRGHAGTLVARYGARPALWLVDGDGPGTDPAIVAQLDRTGQTIETWDAYRQPTGIHYAPHSLFRTHQDQAWLDFQWCQTGHNGEHVPERVADMWRNTPVKAVANGEPTYENIGKSGRGAGWWQGHEAWCNLTAGGTMGLVYGAGSLWQWRRHAREPDHADWCTAPDAGWREALDFEGSRYPGIAARIFDGLPFAGMQPNWTYTYGRRGLAVPGKLFVLYLPEGGDVTLLSRDVPRRYRVFDPRTGQVLSEGRLPDAVPAQARTGPGDGPRVLVFTADGDGATS